MSDYPNILMNRSERELAVLASFLWGDTTTRFSNQAYPIEHLEETWEPMPLLEARFTKAITGAAEAEEVTVSVWKGSQPADTLLLPYKHAPVKVIVRELDLETDHSNVVFRGPVVEAVRSKGEPEIAEIACQSSKLRLKVIPGIQAVSRCTHPFGNSNMSPCDISLADKTWDVELTEIGVDDNPHRVTLTFTGGAPTHSNSYWGNGRIEIGGAMIKIKAWLGGTDFLLKHAINPVLQGEEAVAVAGCRKTKEDCIFWGNLDKFGGVGIVMPDYPPNFRSQ